MGPDASIPLCLDDFRRAARALIPPDAWDFIEGGGGDERTLAANVAAFDRYLLRPRVLVDVSKVDVRTELFGTPLATPLAVAPTAYHRLIHPEGEVAVARGAGEVGALYIVSIFASRRLEDIAAAATGPLWLQLYWLRRRDIVADLIARAEAGGYEAFVLTLDAPRIGQRLRDMRNGFAVGPDAGAVNVEEAVMASAHRSEAGVSAIAAHAQQAFDATLSWDDLAWIRSRTAKPLVLKGILAAEDAARAVAEGVDAISVSNHGGRQLDNVVASIDALAEVVDAVGGAVPVLLDGGVRRGTDAFTALALGASAVLLGRPPLWGLATGGAQGVAEVLRLATLELEHTMALSGRPSLGAIDRSAVVLPLRH